MAKTLSIHNFHKELRIPGHLEIRQAEELDFTQAPVAHHEEMIFETR